MLIEDIFAKLEAEALDCETMAHKEDQAQVEVKRLHVIRGCQIAARKLRDVATWIRQHQELEE